MNPITPKNLHRHELIGLSARVVKSSHPGFLGVQGKVVNETQKTLIISCGNKRKIIPKHASVFLFKLPDGVEVEISGEDIIGRPEDRIEKRVRRR